MQRLVIILASEETETHRHEVHLHQYGRDEFLVLGRGDNQRCAMQNAINSLNDVVDQMKEVWDELEQEHGNENL
jgi:hypothetical protein